MTNTSRFTAVNLVNPHDVMFIDTDKEEKRYEWRGELDQDDNTLAPTQPPENELYQASWPELSAAGRSRHQSFNEQGRRPPAHLEYQTARAALEPGS